MSRAWSWVRGLFRFGRPRPVYGVAIVALSLALLPAGGVLGGARGLLPDSGKAWLTGPGSQPIERLSTRLRLSGSRVESRTLSSRALARTLPYLVYLPPGYDSAIPTRYPVVYMLHGLGGSYQDWENLGLFATADSLIAARQIEPMIIVLPQGDDGYWIDQANQGPRWGTYVARDLVQTIDGSYRTIASRDSRAIGGMSMGAHGAVQLALNFPDEFGVVGAHSLVLRRYDQAFAFFGDRSYFDQHDPVSIVASHPELARSFDLWIDIGQGDGWRPQAEAFHAELSAEKITHVWHEYAGGHDGAYWGSHVAEYLRFYSDALGSRSARAQSQ